MGCELDHSHLLLLCKATLSEVLHSCSLSLRTAAGAYCICCLPDQRCRLYGCCLQPAHMSACGCGTGSYAALRLARLVAGKRLALSDQRAELQMQLLQRASAHPVLSAEHSIKSCSPITARARYPCP
jgi:hypothetical protein